MTSGATSAPPAGAVETMVADVSNGTVSPPTSGGGIANYLSALPVTSVRAGGAGIQSHVGALPSSSQLSGAGIPNYLDSVNQACDASSSASTSECAQAISDYASALSSGDAP